MTMVFRISPLVVIVGLACSGPRAANNGGAPKPQSRPSTCQLAIFHTSQPGVVAWDDLGIAEITCHIDDGLPQCFRQFRAKVCGMGGDIVYALPEKPLRPREQAVVYRGRVAHSRVAHSRVAPPRADGGVVSGTDR